MSHEQQARFDVRNEGGEQLIQDTSPTEQFRNLVYRPENNVSCSTGNNSMAAADPERSLMEFARQLSSAGKLDRKTITALSYLDSQLHQTDPTELKYDMAANSAARRYADPAALPAEAMPIGASKAPQKEMVDSGAIDAAQQGTPTVQDFVQRATSLAQPDVVQQLAKNGLISPESAKIVQSPGFKQVLNALASGQSVNPETLNAYFPADVQQLIAQSFMQSPNQAAGMKTRT